MFGRNEFNPFFILAVVCTAFIEASKVRQMPVEIKALVGQDAKFQCAFPLFRDKSKIRIFWWKDGGREFFKEGQDRRKRFVVENKASGFLQLEDMRFSDAGVYYCRVEGDFTGNGTGTRLIVWDSPEPLKISQIQPADGSLWCNTSGFYPPEYNLTWYKNGQEVMTKENKHQTMDGLTVVSSLLKEGQPAQHGTVYVCKVSHISLKVPALANYTVKIGDTSKIFHHPWWIYLCGGILVLLLFLTILCYKLCKHKAHKDKVQMKSCSRCSEPITAKPKERKKQEPIKKSIEMTPRNPSRTEDATNASAKIKKHHKKRREPMSI
ncbi:natural cytotoxicity triggering receptor 3 ligand 1-like [Hemitrygon akajei]|uniref:natural cytotoxicity triggering receptor 3 ligand 1-like n=1 Tax=Hemitrygon akajei TaxID=2704970 RepID=UPI003BF9770E